jgi:hypothetical protein
MALIRYSECGEELTDRAPFCLRCGALVVLGTSCRDAPQLAGTPAPAAWTSSRLVVVVGAPAALTARGRVEMVRRGLAAVLGLTQPPLMQVMAQWPGEQSQAARQLRPLRNPLPGSARSPFWGRGLAEQVSGRHPQGGGKRDERGDPEVDVCALDPLQVDRAEPDRLGEGFLGQTANEAESADVCCDVAKQRGGRRGTHPPLLVGGTPSHKHNVYDVYR